MVFKNYINVEQIDLNHSQSSLFFIFSSYWAKKNKIENIKRVRASTVSCHKIYGCQPNAVQRRRNHEHKINEINKITEASDLNSTEYPINY